MKKRQKWALAEEITLFPYNRCHYMKKKTETGTGRGNNFISTQSMPLYGKKKTETGTGRGNYFISMQSIS